MRAGLLWFVVVLVVACGGTAPSLARATPSAPPTAMPTATCNPTQPNGDAPPGEDPGPGWYGNGRLYTGLWPNGEILATPSFVEADGSIGMKFPWWRAPGVGVAGDLRITGHEISSSASIRAVIPDGYGQRFQSSGIYFPMEGCYEITARSGDTSLVFVAKVTKVAKMPTPVPTPWSARPRG